MDTFVYNARGAGVGPIRGSIKDYAEITAPLVLLTGKDFVHAPLPSDEKRPKIRMKAAACLSVQYLD